MFFVAQREEINMAIEQAKKFIIMDQYEDANRIVYDTMSLTIKQKVFN